MYCTSGQKSFINRPNQSNAMKKTLLYAILLYAIFAFVALGSAKASKTNPDIGINADTYPILDPSRDWTDERFKEYEDSLLKALYPEVRECHLPDSLFKKMEEGEERPFRVNSGSGINNPIIPDVAIINKSNAVGDIEIRSGVTPTGAKTYEVPINVYPGINGFQPNLSLLYNSQAGNSVIGQGWSLSGIPKITRSGKNLYYDGKCEGVLMDMSDSFFLDGTRLIKSGPISGSCITYESEQGNILINAYVSGETVKYFNVYYPDGSFAQFGYESNSQNRLHYPLVLALDIRDNRIGYIYDDIDNHYRISKIEYNDSHIDFNYKTREDPISRNSGGTWTMERELLESVYCFHGTTFLHEYTLSHSLHNGVSHLDKIGLNSASESFNPIQFIYGEGAEIGGNRACYNYNTTQLLDWYESDNPDMIKTVKGRFDYDSNNDGLIVLPNKNPYWQHYRHSTAFRHSQNRFDNQYGSSERIFLYAGLSEDFADPMPELVTGPGFIDILCADLQGRQEESVIKINNNVIRVTTGVKEHLKFTVYRPNLYGGMALAYERSYYFPTVYTDADGGNSIQPKFYYTGDFNGDGKIEILAVSAHQPFNDPSKPTNCYLFDLENNSILYQGHVFPYVVTFVGTSITDSWDAANRSDKLIPLDADGDGKTDICLINDTGIHTYTFDVDSSGTISPRLLASDNGTKKTLFENRLVMTGDFNGDGLTDLLLSSYRGSTASKNQWYIFRSKGNGQFTRSWFYGTNFPNDRREGFILQDIDCDGKSDLINYTNTHFFTTQCEFNGFEGTSHTMQVNTNSIIVPTDINSHNKFNRLLALRGGIVYSYSFTLNKAREQLLTGMISSVGLVEKNEYSSLCNTSYESGVYTHGGILPFPYVSLSEPAMVISRTETLCNGSLCDASNYEYENAVFHRQGLGFRGFEKITSFDSRGNRTVRTYEPYNHSVLKSVVSTASETVNSYSINIKPNKVKKILLNTKTERNLLTGYSANYSYSYDEHGFPTSEIATHSDGITVKTDLSYGDSSETDGAYSLGFVTDRTVTTTRGDDEYAERTHFQEFEYRHPYVAVKYVNGYKVERIDYTYDDYGNVTKEEVTPYDSPNSLTKRYTYTGDGQLTGETDPWGLTHTYTRDSYGRICGIQDYTGTNSIIYDSFGREIQRTSPDGIKRNVNYEWINDGSPGVYKVSTETTGKPTISESYDALGRIVRLTDTRFDGKIRKIDREFDIRGDLVRESEPYTGNAPTAWTTYEYDTHGRMLTASEPSGRETRHVYSGASVKTWEDEVEITRTYDSQGNFMSSSDDAGPVRYYLTADGKPDVAESLGGIMIWINYDKYRRYSSIGDSGFGNILYEYDSWGNVRKRVCEGKEITYEYDNKNRLKKMVTPEFSTSYTYDAYNRLTDVISDNGTSRSVTYDGYGRIKSRRENAPDGKWLLKDYTYKDGNISTIKYTSQSGELLTESYIYSNGTFCEGKVGDESVYKLISEDSTGIPTKIETGGITREYSHSHGFPTTRKASYGKKALQNVAYEFDYATSNLLCRRNLRHNNSESFEYDCLNRLISAGDQSYTYDILGNMTSRSDVGRMEYHNSYKPHAVTDFFPDGDFVPAATQEFSHTSFSRPESTKEAYWNILFSYNADFDRVKMECDYGNSNETRYYLGKCYEFIDYGNSNERLYLFGDYYDAPAVFTKNNNASEILFPLKDYLGSITHIVKQDGRIEQEVDYDAWGMLRKPDSHEYYGTEPSDAPNLILGRGYTGHERIWENGLINMNARLYDPLMCRFLSPDPQMQFPYFSQGHNRFSYALNNPMRYVDEDGEFFWTAVGIAALIGGTINVATHWDAIQAGGFWTGAQYFLTGAVAGGAGAAVGIGAAVGFGSMLGVTAASYTAATTGFINGALSGAAGGAASGFISETGNSLIEGQNLGNSLLNGLWGAGKGAISGGITGGVAGGIQATQQGKSFWNGTAPDPNRHYSVYYGYDSNGDIRYVGMTGRDPKVRFAEHLKSGTNRANLDYRVADKIGKYTKLEARIWEQSQINKFGMMKNGGLLFNLRNEIAPKYWHLYNFNINPIKTNPFQLWLKESLLR